MGRLEISRVEKEEREKEKRERKKLLSAGFVRSVFNRTKGLPEHCRVAFPGTPVGTKAKTANWPIPFSTPGPATLCSPCTGSTPTSVVDLPLDDVPAPTTSKQPVAPSKVLSPTKSLRSWPPLSLDGSASKRSAVEAPKACSPQKRPQLSLLLLSAETVLPPPLVFKMADGGFGPIALPPPALEPSTFTLPSPVAIEDPCPLSPGSYVLLPRCYLLSWRHYVRAGGPVPDPLAFAPLTCNAHGRLVRPKHLLRFLSHESPMLLNQEEADDCDASPKVEIVTIAEHESLCDSDSRVGQGFEPAVCGFKVSGSGRVAWGDKVCGDCEGGVGRKVIVRTRMRERLRTRDEA